MKSEYVTINGIVKYYPSEFDSYSEFEAFAKYWGVEPVKPE
jgi:hypothetical protein